MSSRIFVFQYSPVFTFSRVLEKRHSTGVSVSLLTMDLSAYTGTTLHGEEVTNSDLPLYALSIPGGVDVGYAFTLDNGKLTRISTNHAVLWRRYVKSIATDPKEIMHAKAYHSTVFQSGVLQIQSLDDFGYLLTVNPVSKDK